MADLLMMAGRTQKLQFCVGILLATALMPACSEFKMDDSLTANASQAPSLSADQLVNSANLLVHVDSANSPVLSAGAISSLKNRVTTFTDLTAPLDLAPNAPTLGSMDVDWISFQPSASGQSFRSPIDKELTSQSVTLIALVKTTSRGDFISVDPLDRTNQAFNISMDASNVTARFYSSPTDSYAVSVPNPTSSTALIAASFGPDVGQLDLAVNGVLNSSAVGTGTALAPFLVGRFLSIGSSTSGSTSELKDLYFFNRQLTKQELGAMIVYVAQQNGVSGTITLDPALSGSGSGTTTDPNWAPVASLIASKCISCHGSWSGAGATYFVTNGLVVKGSPLTSKLYYRLQGSDGASGPKTMPTSGSITASDVLKVKTWIQNMP